jgi:uncharacterized protein (TIGR03435 family)
MKMIRSTCGFALAILLAATAASAQDPAAPPAAAFDVAAVRPSNPNPDPTNPLSQIALMLPHPGGRFTATNTPLRMLIMAAYELKQDTQLAGGPPALLEAKYDITARAAGTATLAMKELPQLLRSLLADRFKLMTHTESRWSICHVRPKAARPSPANTSVTSNSTAGTRPTQRCSQLTGGVRTNVSRMASANGTRTACAQYRTATTSTPPANVNQSFTDFNVSSTFRTPFLKCLPQTLQCC